MQSVVSIVKPGENIDPEIKRYLVLFHGYEEGSDEEIQRYEWCEGRTKTVQFIMENIDMMNVLKSMVIVEDKDISLLDALNVHDFLVITKTNTRQQDGTTLLDQLGYGGINLESYIQSDIIEYTNIEGGDV